MWVLELYWTSALANSVRRHCVGDAGADEPRGERPVGRSIQLNWMLGSTDSCDERLMPRPVEGNRLPGAVVELALLVEEIAGDLALLSEVVADAAGRELVPARGTSPRERS